AGPPRPDAAAPGAPAPDAPPPDAPEPDAHAPDAEPPDAGVDTTPAITRIDPTEGPAGTQLMVFGRNFVTSSNAFNSVRFSATGPIVTPSLVSPTLMIATVPSDAVTGDILVFTGGRVVTSTLTF